MTFLLLSDLQLICDVSGVWSRIHLLIGQFQDAGEIGLKNCHIVVRLIKVEC